MRSLLVRGVLATLALTAAACTEDSDPETTLPPPTESAITVAAPVNYFDPALTRRFVESTGIEVQVDLYDDERALVADVIASGGAGHDLLLISSEAAEEIREAGLLASLDPSLIPQLNSLTADARLLPHDPGGEYSVPYAWGTTGVCWHSERVLEPITGFEELFGERADLDEAFSLLAGRRWLLIPGLVASGLSINTTDPTELETGAALIEENLPRVGFLDDDTFHLRLIDGETVAAVAWDAWCNYAIAEDPAIEFTPVDEAGLWLDVLVIPATSPEQAAAHAFIDALITPTNHAWVIDNIFYRVPSQAAIDAASPTVIEALPGLATPPAELAALPLIRWLGEADAEQVRLTIELTQAFRN